jgi:hypothetical protein
MIDEHRLRLLEIGAPGRLLIAGEIDDVLPLDDAELLDEAKPITPEVKVRLDPEKLKARPDAQVKSGLEKGALGLIVLGGAHDLSDSVRRLLGQSEDLGDDLGRGSNREPTAHGGISFSSGRDAVGRYARR